MLSEYNAVGTSLSFFVGTKLRDTTRDVVAIGICRDMRIKYQRQREIGLRYKGKIIGNHRLDFLVEGEIILEIKASDGISDIYIAQVLTYLRATKKRVGLLINFNVERLKDGLRRLIV